MTRRDTADVTATSTVLPSSASRPDGHPNDGCVHQSCATYRFVIPVDAAVYSSVSLSR